MKNKKTLKSLVLAGALALGGVASLGGQSYAAETNRNRVLYGVPLSAVQNSRAHCLGAFAAVFDVNGEKVLAYHVGWGNSSNPKNNAEAEALVLSEISDGDNEKVEISGKYVGDRFKLSTLKANGYKVDWSN